MLSFNNKIWMWTIAVVLINAVLSTSNTLRGEVGIPRACKPPHAHYPFCDVNLSVKDRISDLIKRLTLDEKPYLLVARESPKGNISRLGIPEYDWGGNCMHGVQSHCSSSGKCPTSFPNSNTLGSTFNRTLWYEMAQVIGLELRALWLQNVGENQPKSKIPHIGLDCWSPNINIQRDPRWGRNMETPSEDPFVCANYGVQHTLGLQYNEKVDKKYLQAVATLKHFVANSIEGNWFPNGTYNYHSDKKHKGPITRHTDNVIVSQYDLASTYLLPFQMAVQHAGAAGVMCSYNRVNGAPSCANEWLLKKRLRGDWGFNGYVTSDSGALDDIVNGHQYTPNDLDLMVKTSLTAGCDVESKLWGHYPKGPWSTGGHYIDTVPKAVRAGTLREALLDTAVRHALEIRFRLGLFDPIEDQPFWHISPDVVESDAHVALAIDATAQGFVLLKNGNDNAEKNQVPLLPLDRFFEEQHPGKHKIAMIGPHVNDRHVLLGNYLGEICKDDASNKCVTTFYEGLQGLLDETDKKVVNVTGCSVNGTSTADFDAAIGAAQSSDVVIFVGGLDLNIEAEGRDRPDIRLPKIQMNLLKAIAKAQPNIVLVLVHGGMVGGLEDIISDKNINLSIVSTGYPGKYAGPALARSLWGKTTRAWGKLAITWYKAETIEKNELHMLDFDMTRPPGRTYRYFRGEPLFPFGHGLNPLTKFELTKGDFTSTSKDYLNLNIELTNVGSRRGDEVVMLYFEPTEIPSEEPASYLKKQLFGFQRVSDLDPGKSIQLTFTVNKRTDWILFNDAGEHQVFPGKYNIIVTTSGDNKVAQEQQHLTTTTRIFKVQVLEDGGNNQKEAAIRMMPFLGTESTVM